MAIFINPETGERFENVPDDQAEIAQSEFGLVTPEAYALQQRPLTEKAADVAVTGLQGVARGAMAPGMAIQRALGGPALSADTGREQSALTEGVFGPEALERKERNPLAAGIGESVPSMLAGGAMGAGGVGIGSAALGLAGESGLSGLSQEAISSEIEGRDFDLGNAAQAAAVEFALGGAVLGGVKVGNLFLGGAGKGVMSELPKGIAAGPGNVKKAVTAVEAASDEGVVDVMAQAAEGATKKKAKIATDLPPGPERAEALASTADVHYDRMATEFAAEADKVDAVMSKLGDTSASPMVEQRLRETIGEQSPAQMRAVTETAELGSAFRRELTKPLDEVVEEAPLKWADDAPPVSGEQPVVPFKPGEGFNFETGAIEPSAKPPKPAKPRTLATTNKLRGIASEIDTTIRNMTTKLDKSSDSVDWYLAMRKAKQEMQDTVRTLGGMADKGDEVLHGKLQKMSDDFATHLKNELTKQEHWGKAAEIEAGINAAWHDKWLKGRLIVHGSLTRKVGRQYRTGRELVEYDPAMVRSFMKGDKVSRTITQRHLDNIVDGWEDMAKVHELHGTASPADIKLLRDAAKRAREKMALVDEIQDAVAGRVTKKANPIVEMATDIATDLIPGGSMIRGLVKKGLKTETGKQMTSAAYERGMSILKRREGQTGAVLIENEDSFETFLRKGQAGDPEELKALVKDHPSGLLNDLSEQDLEKLIGVGVLPHEALPIVAGNQNFIKLDIESPFVLERSIVRETNGDLVAVHSTIKLPDSLKGQGLMRSYLRDAAEVYQKMGIERIRIPQAIDDGIVVWPKMGATGGDPLILKLADEAGLPSDSLESIARHKRGPRFLQQLFEKEHRLFSELEINVSDLRRRLAAKPGQDGFVDLGTGAVSNISLGGIARSPMGLTSGIGLAGVGALGYAKSQRDLETQADRIVSTDESGKLMTKQTGRTLAGVGSSFNDRNSGEELPPAPTALGRFTDGYADPESSFEAKRKLLDAEQISPTVLYEVMGASFGDLPRMSPELFQQMAQRTAQGIRYLRDNMPAGISTTLLYPNGTPPSRSALRDWATMWNTFTDPETVLEDINNGTAVPLQMQTLRDVHPDIYDQLKADVIEQVGTHFRSVPTSTKAQLDLLFQADGLAGPMWSSAAADQIGKAMAAEKEKGMNPGAQSGGGEALGSASGPGGIEAIKTSVTNRGN